MTLTMQDSVAEPGEPVVAHFDGLCEPVNPGGIACGGWSIQPHPTIPDGMRGHAVYGSGPEFTNNWAEYNAALDCLRAIYRTGYRGPVALHGDSRLVVEQFNGTWACRSPHLQPLLERLRHAAQHFESVTLTWVPRTANTEADAESRQAYQAYKEATR